MKKFMVLGAAMCVAMAFTGCKSSESAYKKAYEKAKSQEQLSDFFWLQRRVQTHVQRFLMLLTISARSMISSSAARKLRISLRISRMQLQTLSKS